MSANRPRPYLIWCTAMVGFWPSLLVGGKPKTAHSRCRARRGKLQRLQTFDNAMQMCPELTVELNDAAECRRSRSHEMTTEIGRFSGAGRFIPHSFAIQRTIV